MILSIKKITKLHADQSASLLLANPEDRFSHVKAHLIVAKDSVPAGKVYLQQHDYKFIREFKVSQKLRYNT